MTAFEKLWKQTACIVGFALLATHCSVDEESNSTANGALSASSVVGTWAANCLTHSKVDTKWTLVATETKLNMSGKVYPEKSSCADAGHLWTTVHEGTFKLGDVFGQGTKVDLTYTSFKITSTAAGLKTLQTTCAAAGSTATFTATKETDLTSDKCGVIFLIPGYQIVAVEGTNLFFGDYISDTNYNGSTDAKRPINLGASLPFAKK